VVEAGAGVVRGAGGGVGDLSIGLTITGDGGVRRSSSISSLSSLLVLTELSSCCCILADS